MIAILFLGVHFMGTIAVVFRQLGNGLAFNDTLPSAPSSPFVEIAASILTFPVFLIPASVAPSLVWWIPFLLNSLLWTLVLFAAIRYSRVHFRWFDPPLPNTR